MTQLARRKRAIIYYNYGYTTEIHTTRLIPKSGRQRKGTRIFCRPRVRLDRPVRKARQVRLPQSIPSDEERQRVHRRERFAHHPSTCRRLHRQTTGSSRYSERRQADTNARPSSVPRPTRHRLLLPRMLLQMASHPRRTRTHQGRTTICRSRTYGLDRKTIVSNSPLNGSCQYLHQ